MRPSSTRRSMPSSAIVFPNILRRPRASMHAMASALLLVGVRFSGVRFGGLRLCSIRRKRRRPAGWGGQGFFRPQPEPLNRRVDPGPFFAKKPLAFALQQQAVRPGIDKHAAPSSGFDKPLVHPLLIA